MPIHRMIDSLREIDAEQQMVERDLVRRVCDHEDAAAVPARDEIAQERRGAIDDVAVALAGRPRLVDVGRPLLVEAGARHAVAPAVVALAQALVDDHRDRAARERDSNRLEGTLEVGDVDRRQAVVPPPLTELGGRFAAPLGQPAR